MTKDEVRSMMKYFQTAYDGFYKNANLSDVLGVWCDAFKDVDKVCAEIAAKRYVDMNTRPPTIAGVKEQLRLITEEDEATAMWKYIVRAAKNSTYGSVEEFNKLPTECQRFVGSASALKDYGQVDPATLQTVVKAHFMKAIPSIKKHLDARYELPLEVREVIENAKAQRLLEEHLY